jgi:DNA-binding protein HU-beta
MNKTDLIEFVAQHAKLTKADSEKAVNAVFKGIADTLSKGGEARFVGFGTFSVSKRSARTGRNPQTGATINIAASSVPRFRPGKELKDSVN